MNAKNLPLKFAFVALLVAICLYALYAEGLQYGIDLQGGHSLTFEIRSPEADAKALKAELAEQKKLLEGATTKDAKDAINIKINSLEGDIARAERGDSGGKNLAEQMIEILKERIDPQGLANLEWRPVGSNRIEVRMPAAREDTRQKQDVYDRAMRKLTESNVSRAQRRKYLYAPAEQRGQMLGELTEEQVQALKELGEAFDAQQAAEKAVQVAQASGDEQAIAKAQAAFDAARAVFREKDLAQAETNIRASRIEGILRNFRTAAEEEGIKDKDKKQALRDQLTRDISSLRTAYPGRVALIESVVEAYKAWASVRHRLSDPADLQRRIARSGVLEFRIVAGDVGEQISKFDRERYTAELQKEGPEESRRSRQAFAWFPIRDTDRKSYGGMVMAEYAGRWYMLLSNRDGYKMVRDQTRGGWQLDDAFRDSDQMGRPVIGFKFNEKGAQQFYNLTNTHKEKCMAILLDDEVFSAPRIQTAISSRGQITGTFTREQIDENISLLKAGSLPARLNSTPVAVRSFGPTLGKENRDSGIRAAYMGLICVAVFMLIYYLLGGVIANVALILNIILVLGAMSLLSAVFTLPGIAGVILTIGIAVDANVLIFERLREEQAKGQTIRMALKNAYERAFTAIFDANITTMLTCLILGWVGTIEVRGFAITLGLGVLFSMFTALIVTRWVFQVLLDSNWLKTPVKMLSIIGVPKVNWMAKRKVFWALSAAMIILGIAAMIGQGSNILGIEFSSGTQAVIQFKPDALVGPDQKLPNDGLVRRLFAGQASKDAKYKGLNDARVEMLIDSYKVDRFLGMYDKDGDRKISPAEVTQGRLNPQWVKLMDSNKDDSLDEAELANLPASSYQVSTTETVVGMVQDVARGAFGKNLQQRTKCTFVPAAGEKIAELALMPDAQGLSQIEPDPTSAQRDLLENYAGGVAVVVKDVNPAISEADLKQRISETRAQDSGGSDVARLSEVIGLGKPVADTYSKFAVLIMLDEVAPGRWSEAAEQQRQVVVDALEREEAIVAISFDPAIAGMASQRAIMAIVLSWIAIVLYLWLRFGSIQWGLAAVICLIHDAVIVVGLIAASGWIYNTFVGQALGMEWFKIDLTMIAAILTVIGYSVNDTIVVFDRIRENRGKLTTVSVPVINKSINQTLARTLLTSGTTLIVVLIMYIWGGQGIKGFNFALLAGILFGTYSSVAIASPLLMGFKKALFAKAADLVPPPVPNGK